MAKSVYTCFCTDNIHEGHLNILNVAKSYGDVTVGILQDSEMIKYNRFPIKSTHERVEIVKNLPGVKNVIIQKNMMYDDIVKELHPDFIVHGDNWDSPALAAIHDNIVAVLARHGGQLIEVPYTRNARVQKADSRMREILSHPEFRRSRLRKLLNIVPIVKTIEVHSGLTGLIAEKTVVAEHGEIAQFDAMWISSLCDSTNMGKPDIEVVEMGTRLRNVDSIMEVTTKPIIIDGDTGGLPEHFRYTVRTLERMGISAVIIEDKTGLKKNSLFGTEVEQTQDSIENFCQKIKAGKDVQLSDSFMIIARIESLILGQGQDDALTRARAYVDAGADGIMIHSRSSDPSEIFTFCDAFRAEDTRTPLVAVPTSYNSVTEKELAEHGVNICIYANHLLRAAFPVMENAAKSILINHRSKEIDSTLMPIKRILTMIDPL